MVKKERVKKKEGEKRKGGKRGEGDIRGWDGWMASPTRWTWVWVNFRSCWWTRRPGVLQFMGSQKVGHDWVTELNWTRLVITFLPRNKCLLISWLQLPSTVILEPKKIKSVTVSIVSPLFAMKWWDQMPRSSFFECWVLSQLFECWVLSQLFHFPLSFSSRGFQELVPVNVKWSKTSNEVLVQGDTLF